MLQFIMLCVVGFPNATGVYTPMFTEVPAIRASAAPGVLLNDIDSHMPRGHIFSSTNLITWAHETTHGINADVRNVYMRSHAGQYNAFYVTGNKSVIVKDPDGSIADVIAKMPKWLQDSTFQNYKDRYKEWNDRPLYICDEWSAYTNGLAVQVEMRIDQNLEGNHAVHMGLMSLVMMWALQADDTQLQAYIAWNWERVISLLPPSHSGEGMLANFRHSDDSAELRNFVRGRFGNAWAEEVFGF